MNSLYHVFVSEIWEEYKKACPHNEDIEEGTQESLCSNPDNDGTISLEGNCKRCALPFCPDSEEVYAISRNRMFIRDQNIGTIDFEPPEGFEPRPKLKLVVNQ